MPLGRDVAATDVEDDPHEDAACSWRRSVPQKQLSVASLSLALVKLAGARHVPQHLDVLGKPECLEWFHRLGGHLAQVAGRTLFRRTDDNPRHRPIDLLLAHDPHDRLLATRVHGVGELGLVAASVEAQQTGDVRGEGLGALVAEGPRRLEVEATAAAESEHMHLGGDGVHGSQAVSLEHSVHGTLPVRRRATCCLLGRSLGSSIEDAPPLMHAARRQLHSSAAVVPQSPSNAVDVPTAAVLQQSRVRRRSLEQRPVGDSLFWPQHDDGGLSTPLGRLWARRCAVLHLRHGSAGGRDGLQCCRRKDKSGEEPPTVAMPPPPR
eukprot:scaffold1638_cov258-Pinguiococcus_pyrenoidosus.AAC.29